MELLANSILVILVLGFSFIFIAGKIKGKYETNLQSLLTMQCGGSFGLSNFCTPLVRHTLYKDFLIIGYGLTKHKLMFKDVSFVTKSPYLFSKALRYHHSNHSLPKRIIIRSKRTCEIIEVLRLQNVNIKNV